MTSCDKKQLLDILLAEYQVVGNALTTSCTIAHSRFLAFLSVQVATFVGFFVISSHASKIVLAVLSILTLIFFMCSTVRDSIYLHQRYHMGKKIEEAIKGEAVNYSPKFFTKSINDLGVEKICYQNCLSVIPVFKPVLRMFDVIFQLFLLLIWFLLVILAFSNVV